MSPRRRPCRCLRHVARQGAADHPQLIHGEDPAADGVFGRVKPDLRIGCVVRYGTFIESDVDERKDATAEGSRLTQRGAGRHHGSVQRYAALGIDATAVGLVGLDLAMGDGQVGQGQRAGAALREHPAGVVAIDRQSRRAGTGDGQVGDIDGNCAGNQRDLIAGQAAQINRTAGIGRQDRVAQRVESAIVGATRHRRDRRRQRRGRLGRRCDPAWGSKRLDESGRCACGSRRLPRRCRAGIGACRCRRGEHGRRADTGVDAADMDGGARFGGGHAALLPMSRSMISGDAASGHAAGRRGPRKQGAPDRTLG